MSIIELSQYCQKHNKSIIVRKGQLKGFKSNQTSIKDFR